MAEKRNNKYKIQLEEIELKDGTQAGKALEFQFTNHDNVFELIQRSIDKRRFESDNDNIEFMVGLKLFSEVMLRNRNHPLFEDFLPAFGEFMKKVKGKS